MTLQKIFAFTGAVGLVFLSGSVFAQSNPGESLARLQAAVATQKIALDDATKTQVQNICKSTQASLQALHQKEPKNYKAYTETYLDIQNEISALEIRLKRQGVTTQGVDRTLMNYKERVDQYERLNFLYQQALGDTLAIECKDNPNEFIAGVSTVRQIRGQLLQTTTGLHDYIYNDVRDQFTKVKVQLKV